MVRCLSKDGPGPWMVFEVMQSIVLDLKANQARFPMDMQEFVASILAVVPGQVAQQSSAGASRFGAEESSGQC